jgi:hypothetical protein
LRTRTTGAGVPRGFTAIAAQVLHDSR